MVGQQFVESGEYAEASFDSVDIFKSKTKDSRNPLQDQLLKRIDVEDAVSTLLIGLDSRETVAAILHEFTC